MPRPLPYNIGICHIFSVSRIFFRTLPIRVIEVLLYMWCEIVLQNFDDSYDVFFTVLSPT